MAVSSRLSCRGRPTEMPRSGCALASSVEKLGAFWGSVWKGVAALKTFISLLRRKPAARNDNDKLWRKPTRASSCVAHAAAAAYACRPAPEAAWRSSARREAGIKACHVIEHCQASTRICIPEEVASRRPCIFFQHRRRLRMVAARRRLNRKWPCCSIFFLFFSVMPRRARMYGRLRQLGAHEREQPALARHVAASSAS